MATVEALMSARWRPRRHRWSALATILAAAMIYPAIAGWRDRHALLVNRTNSLPNWAFLIHRTSTARRGDYLFFLPPRHAVVVRHFGPRPEMFGKIVYGVAGDMVAHAGRTVWVAGRPVARIKPRTRAGEPLTPGATGRVPPGCYYAGSPHPDGFDSRYAEIGFVCADAIVGVGEPIL